MLFMTEPRNLGHQIGAFKVKSKMFFLGSMSPQVVIQYCFNMACQCRTCATNTQLTSKEMVPLCPMLAI